MAATVQEALYLQLLLGEMGVVSDVPTPINEDNESCIKMCKNPVMQKRTKHIDVKCHFLREQGNMKQLNSNIALLSSWKLTC